MISTHVNLTIAAAALQISSAEHVNKLPFSGVLARVGQAFDVVVDSGATRRATLCAASAQSAARSLVSMGVAVAADLDTSASGKVGLITSAHIEGNAVMAAGFIYASDFTGLARVIREDQHDLGFEVEARGTLSSGLAASAELDAITFTGCRLVRRTAAHTWPTSIAAAAVERRTISAAAAYALQRGSVAIPQQGGRLSHSQIEACLAGIDDPVRRIAMRRTLEREGLA